MSRLTDRCPVDHTNLTGDIQQEPTTVKLTAMQIMGEIVIYAHVRAFCHECRHEFITPVRLFAAEGLSLGSSWEEVGAALSGVLAQA